MIRIFTSATTCDEQVNEAALAIADEFARAAHAGLTRKEMREYLRENITEAMYAGLNDEQRDATFRLTVMFMCGVR